MQAWVWLFALLSGASIAAQPLPPGTYISDGGRGTLRVEAVRDGAQRFSLNEVGANFHTCDLEGDVRAGSAALPTFDEAVCRISFSLQADGILVEQDENDVEHCRYFCGARAGFGGVYLSIAPACAPDRIAAQRKAFKKAYDQKRFADAAAMLESVLPTCERTLTGVDHGWIASDLAITRHKLGDHSGCVAVLESYRELASMDEAAIRDSYPPSEADVYARLARAVRTNLKLCGKPAGS